MSQPTQWLCLVSFSPFFSCFILLISILYSSMYIATTTMTTSDTTTWPRYTTTINDDGHVTINPTASNSKFLLFFFFVFYFRLFVHHYLPSHIASVLIAGAVLNFVLSKTINYLISIRGPKIRKVRTLQYSDIGIKGPAILVVFGLIMFIMIVFFAPH